MHVTDGGSMPINGHGTNNLDTGLDITGIAQSDAFMDIANATFGIEPDLLEDTIAGAIPDEEVLEPDVPVDEAIDPVEEEEVPADEPVEQYYVVTLDGEEIEVSEDELLGGYQRQRDYTKKTQEVAAERKQVKADLEMLATERTKYTSALESIIAEDAKALEKYNEVNWTELRKENPNEFLMLQYEMQEARAALQEKITARNDAFTQADTEKQIADTEFMKREGERVAQLVEGWNGENATALRNSLREQSGKEGFTEEDEGLLKHAMVIHLLQKAKLYDDLQDKSANVGKKKLERIVPKVVKSGAKGSSEQAAQVVANQTAMTKLNQTGRISDSISIFEQFL